MKKEINFKECPRPQFVRDNWTSLNGTWEFSVYDGNHVWPDWKEFKKQYDIVVPFCYLTEASGVNVKDRYDCLYYRRVINISKKEGKRYILHFEGADYCLVLNVNKKYVGEDTGAYHRMSFDITDFVVDGDNELFVTVLDNNSTSKPRGKQRWTKESCGCHYIETTGIYKEVWLEEVNETYIEKAKITPLADSKEIKINFAFIGDLEGYSLAINVLDGNKNISKTETKVLSSSQEVTVKIDSDITLWSVENPYLYDLEFVLVKNEEIKDRVMSYCGFRTLKIENGKIYLNNKELYQKLVLDQGYWLEGDLTPKDNKQLYDDIKIMMDFGFNGARKHQKLEDDRFMYYCDVLGYLLWCEMASMYDLNPTSKLIFEREWMLEVEQEYNHPSIITWTPFNESWGIFYIKNNKDTQDFVNYIYKKTKEYDPYRFVITNDGWEHTISDILTMHHYEQDGDKLNSYYNTVEKCTAEIWESHHKGAFADGYSYKGQPIMVSEFGGTAFVDNNKSNWGYGTAVTNKEEYANRLTSLFESLQKIPFIVGYCFTQVSDVQQEVNGLVYGDRTPKIDPSILKKVQDKRN